MQAQPICQIGIVVRDIEAKVKAWAQVFGLPVPPITVTAPWEESHTAYRGQPTAARAKLAFFKFGQLELELIEPDEHPSTWRSFLVERGEGVHHVAFKVEELASLAKELRAHHISLEQSGDYPGGCYAYFNATSSLGLVLELLQDFSEKGNQSK